MSWAEIRAKAEASALELTTCREQLERLGVKRKMVVDEYGVWKVWVKRPNATEPELCTARGG